MMYTLTQKEYDELTAEQEINIAISDAKLQKLCTKIANEMPVKWGWGGKDPKPWGCIITAEERGEEWYCDTCPVQMICPNPNQTFSQ